MQKSIQPPQYQLKMIMVKNTKQKFIDSFRFISSSLSSLADNLSDRLYNDKYIDCKSYLDYMLIKDDHLILRCFE